MARFVNCLLLHVFTLQYGYLWYTGLEHIGKLKQSQPDIVREAVLHSETVYYSVRMTYGPYFE
jgi:hypothetical protein